LTQVFVFRPYIDCNHINYIKIWFQRKLDT